LSQLLEALMSLAHAPISVVLNAVSVAQPFPDIAIASCAYRMEEAAPPLLALLERAADGEKLSNGEEVLLFRGIHLLGGNRREKAFKPLLRLLAQDPERVDLLLGDAITETLPRIAAGMFDGDTVALLSAITAGSTEAFVRNSLLHAATFLTFDGRIGRDVFTGFLEGFFRQRLAPQGDPVWAGWVEAVAFLGLAEFRPMVKAVFDEEVIDPSAMTFEYFERDLEWALRDAGDPERIKSARLGYIEDSLDSLLWTRHFNEEDPSDYSPGLLSAGVLPQYPEINMNRDVGRNDPCPCGSGRKYKKCCLV
jgi:Protein of unknown function (DUF1186)/SEC-C motif